MNINQLYAPYSRLTKAFVRLVLTEHVEVTTRTELSQKARPPRSVQRSIERWQKRVVQYFQYVSLNLCPTIFIPSHQLFLVHHLCSKHTFSSFTRLTTTTTTTLLELHEVHAPYVAAAKAADEAEVVEAEGGVFGFEVSDCVPTWVVGWRVGLGGG